MTTVTTRGQITIPKPLRERFGLRPGTRVRVVERDGALVVEKVVEPDALDAWTGAVDLGEPVDDWIAAARDGE